eukprot:TRINITY_DN80580_c0_g1_i1.p1 TRINITY_DN80580_c0_g1~~TRINITY_DN80580_c0_g1_i1.p1  ORF type:complete len:221 (+),score=67.39 TRINITY_DN80580_c0_g1_i1:49-711(+)
MVLEQEVEALTLSRPNRWKRSPDQTHEAEDNKRFEGSILAMMVLLPDVSEDLLRDALSRHNGNADDALEELLAESDEPDEIEEPQEQKDADADQKELAAAIAAAEAAEEEERREALAASRASQAAEQAEQPAREEPPKPQKPEIPSWLPLLRQEQEESSGNTGGGISLNFQKRKSNYSIQTDRLKAALGSISKPSSSIVGSHDSEFKKGAGKGNARAGGG